MWLCSKVTDHGTTNFFFFGENGTTNLVTQQQADENHFIEFDVDKKNKIKKVINPVLMEMYIGQVGVCSTKYTSLFTKKRKEKKRN